VPKKLLALNLVLGAVSAACIAFTVRQLALAPPATVPSPPRRPGASAERVAPTPDLRPPPASAYSVVATRSVFSPTRTETTTGNPGAAAGFAVVKPSMHGVVLRDTNPIAYLEDPLTKRVAGYRIGDSIAGGTVKTIAADRVVIARPDGEVDVRLHDPSKPRPAPPAPAAPPGRAAVPIPGAGAVPTVRTPANIIPPGLPATLVPPRAQLPRVQAPPGVSLPAPGRLPAPNPGRRFLVPPIGNVAPQR